MTEELSLTARRRDALEQVRDGRVTFDTTLAQWLVDGEVTSTGWAGRTFAELLRAGYLTRRETRRSKVSTVDITATGRTALGQDSR